MYIGSDSSVSCLQNLPYNNLIDRGLSLVFDCRFRGVLVGLVRLVGGRNELRAVLRDGEGMVILAD